MARKLVVCCDGTWNRPRQNTNIFRTYEFLRKLIGNPPQLVGRGAQICEGISPAGDEIVLFYDQGVGTELGERFFGGATGAGLSSNVIDAYCFLGERYSPGSEIYCFGFSRGAYTARSLVGFIGAAGLIRNPTREQANRAYLDEYVTEDAVHPGARVSSSERGALFRRLRSQIGDLLGGGVAGAPRHPDVKIRFLGVYDTVGALGIPISQPAIARLSEPIVGFHRTDLGELVEHAVHALAIDERRAPYQPTLWTLPSGANLHPGQTVLQVWFPGVHSDIGGGYDDKGVGNHTWTFMMSEAAHRGLVLDGPRSVPDVPLLDLPSQHESLDDRWNALATRFNLGLELPRKIGRTTRDGQQVAGDVRLHWSVAARVDKDVDVILDEHVSRRRTIRYGQAWLLGDPRAADLPLPELERAAVATTAI